MDLASLSANPRYRLLSEQILDARGEDITIAISGVERLRTTADSIVPEAACTSTQFHVQTSPDQFADYWNASQAIAAVQLAVGANSPYLLGKELWRETRIPLFEQATDTRSEELKAQGVRPRVWFGERWITSVFDLFEENVRFFPALLPITADEDPLAELEAGRAPAAAPSCACTTAPSTGGTGRSTTWPGECRTCGSRTGCWRPARPSPTRWPTRRSTSGWCGRSRRASGRCGPRCRSVRPRRTSTWPRGRAIDAQIYWPGVGQVRATELVLRRLLPLAQEGLESWGASTAEIDRLPRDHRAALPARHQRRRVVRPADGPTPRPGSLRRAPRHAARLQRRHAQQRPGALLARLSASSAGPQPLPLPAYAAARVDPPVPGDHDERQLDPGLRGGGPGRGQPQRVEVLQLEAARVG